MANEFLFSRKVALILAVPLAADLSTVSAQVTKIENLRVSFKVTKSLTKDPNSAEIKVYNLSAATRAKLPGKGAKVILQAGYDQTIEQVFIGDARIIESKQEGPDWVTSIECGDGARAAASSRVSTSFAGGTKVADVITKIGKTLKIDLGNLSDVARGVKGEFVQGYAAHGSSIKELDTALKAAGFELSIQDGALQVLAPGAVTTEQVIVLDSSSGLIGSPEMGSGDKKDKPPFLKAKSLLQPALKPGRKVHIKSIQYDGNFRVSKVEHTGDTAGQDWYSELELQAL